MFFLRGKRSLSIFLSWLEVSLFDKWAFAIFFQCLKKFTSLVIKPDGDNPVMRTFATISCVCV